MVTKVTKKNENAKSFAKKFILNATFLSEPSSNEI